MIQGAPTQSPTHFWNPRDLDRFGGGACRRYDSNKAMHADWQGVHVPLVAAKVKRDILTCRVSVTRSADMAPKDLTLEELSALTGVEPRTLRSWVSEGLLAPPFKQGRGARYPASNADRALAVRSLKDVHGLSLSEIGRRFMLATEEEIRDWAREAGPTAAPPGSARDYLRKLQGPSRDPTRREPPLASASPDHAPPGKRLADWPPQARHARPQAEDREADLASIERLILQLEKVLDAPAPRRARGTIWTRISVTPDLELSVRGDLEPRERMLFEQLADQFRAILTRRTRND